MQKEDDNHKWGNNLEDRPHTLHYDAYRQVLTPQGAQCTQEPNIGLHKQRPPRKASNKGTPTVASQWPASRAAGTGSCQPGDDIGPVPSNMGGITDLLVRVLKAQVESNFAMHQSFQATMLESIRATGTAVSTTGTIKGAKLTKSKLRILRACSGEDDRSLFILSKVYAEVDREGHTTGNYSRIMRRLVVAVPGSAHKCNVHITPKLVATVKLMNFSGDDDQTYVGCSKGIIPFSVPWLSAEMVNNDLAEERYYQQLTLKSTADIRKRESSSRFDPPTSLLGLV